MGNHHKHNISIFILVMITHSMLHGQFRKQDTTKRAGSAAIPTFGYNQSYGAQFGATAMLFYNLDKEDTVSPLSTFGLGGFYSTNNSWFVYTGQRLFFSQDNWRIAWALGTGNINFQFYADEIPGTDGIYIDYTTTAAFVYITGSHRIYDRLYGGLSFSASKLNTEFYLEDLVGMNPDSLKVLSGWGIPLSYDSRDNIYNASKGLHVDLRTHFRQKWMGSDLNFSTLQLKVNYYTKIHSKAVLASRLKIYGGLGEVPFEGQRVIGRNDIRGYTKGTHRGSQIYTGQVEYRHTFHKKWGYVAFFGLAASMDSILDKWSGVLPGGGAGIRFKALPDHDINIGVEVAVGKSDWGTYFRIGEAF